MYICVFKKQLEIIPFLFSSQNDRKAARAQKTEQYMRIKERITKERERKKTGYVLLYKRIALLNFQGRRHQRRQ